MAKREAHLPVRRENGDLPELFEERPIRLDGFVLRARAAEAIGRPSLQQWAGAFNFATATEDASPFWVGDLWNYATEDRPEWKERIPQTLAEFGRPLAMQTIYNLGSVSTKVKGKARSLAPSVAHAAAVQSLPAAEQEEMLEDAREKGLSVRELSLEVRAKKRRGTIEGRAVLEGMFRVWHIDCPWRYEQLGAKAHDHYQGMTLAELLKMGEIVRAHCTKDAVAFFWTTAPFLYYATDPGLGPDPYRVIRAFGFEPKTGAVWDKVNHNFGNYVSIRHEHLIIATRGSCTPDRPTPMFDSVFTERPADDADHSQKPASVFSMIERLYDGPYVDMFGRARREGWTVFGNDARLWAQEAVATA